MKSASGMAYRADIDGLRAVAVLPVIFFHAGVDLFSGGFVGVDVFFVVSGYLITSIILTEIRAGTFTYLGFYERRVRRIFPALFLMMGVSLPLGLFVLVPEHLHVRLRQVLRPICIRCCIPGRWRWKSSFTCWCRCC